MANEGMMVIIRMILLKSELKSTNQSSAKSERTASVPQGLKMSRVSEDEEYCDQAREDCGGP